MRIGLCIAEDDLRAWVMEELMLMTWVSQPVFVTALELSAVDPTTLAVLVVGIERLAPQDLAHLQANTTVPIIAIGADAGIPNAHVLPAKLTSRELKQAIRAKLTPPPRTPESAVV